MKIGILGKILLIIIVILVCGSWGLVRSVRLIMVWFGVFIIMKIFKVIVEVILVISYLYWL